MLKTLSHDIHSHKCSPHQYRTNFLLHTTNGRKVNETLVLRV